MEHDYKGFIITKQENGEWDVQYNEQWTPPRKEYTEDRLDAVIDWENMQEDFQRGQSRFTRPLSKGMTYGKLIGLDQVKKNLDIALRWGCYY